PRELTRLPSESLWSAADRRVSACGRSIAGLNAEERLTPQALPFRADVIAGGLAGAGGHQTHRTAYVKGQAGAKVVVAIDGQFSLRAGEDRPRKLPAGACLSVSPEGSNPAHQQQGHRESERRESCRRQDLSSTASGHIAAQSAQRGENQTTRKQRRTDERHHARRDLLHGKRLHTPDVQ